MTMLERFKKIVEENTLQDIYLIGFMDVENGIAEFVASMNFLYFEFGNQLFQFETVNQYSRLSITMVDSIQSNIDLEDVIPSKSRVSDIILINPLIDNSVANIEFFNLEESETELLCDAVNIQLSNKQDIFLDPSFLGINIGGLEVKKMWLDNLRVPNSHGTIIKFNY